MGRFGALVLPNDRGRDWSGLIPACPYYLPSTLDRLCDHFTRCAAKPASSGAFDLCHRFFENFVKQVTEGECIQRQRFISFFRFGPPETIGPEIAQGIAQKLDQ